MSQNNNNQIESRLWSAADELRANYKLKSSEYSVPVLGLIFLRYADQKFGAVEPRDLRSNDIRVLNIIRAYEQKYSQGYFITKHGETPPASKYKDYVIDLVDLGKYLKSWHFQRPNIAYSETKIFDKYFEQLFKKGYPPEKAQALNVWIRVVWQRWSKENPLSLNESLLAMRSQNWIKTKSCLAGIRAAVNQSLMLIILNKALACKERILRPDGLLINNDIRM